MRSSLLARASVALSGLLAVGCSCAQSHEPFDAFVPGAEDASITVDAALDTDAMIEDATVDDAAILVDAATTPQRIFVTESTYTGALAGPDGVDRLCGDAAEAAGLTGTWIAWLSMPESDAIDRIDGDGPFVDMAGAIVFPTRAALATGPIGELMLDEHGDPQSLVLVWTGTTFDGTSSGDDCQQWSSARNEVFGTTGQTGSVPGEWTRRGAFPCDELAHLYCFEQL